MPSAVLHSEDFQYRPVSNGMAHGLEVAVMAAGSEGSVHLEVALERLAPGGRVAGHRHFFEESFYVLGGETLVSIDGHEHHLRENDFGLVPGGIPHAWSNPFDGVATWFRMRSPQPRQIGASNGTLPSSAVAVPETGDMVGPPHPTVRNVGRFEEHHLPAPGPISMKGYRGPNIDTVSIWMLVDEYFGAIQHTMFIVEFLPGSTTHPAGDHFHPFEEAYYFLRGSAMAHLDGRELPVRSGDLVFAGTNAIHGFEMTSEEPTRWIEVQAPAPAAHSAFTFPEQWK